MGVEEAFFVQFPHPGDEHRPQTDQMPWNTGDHRRKFLAGPGRYVDAGDRVEEAELVFWGEWEPPSVLERRWRPSGRLPRALHRPYWAEPAGRAPRQNTDPWVFGDHMIYSCCKQVIGLERRPTSMQRLTRGSVICFGSTIDGEFCVDTVFVVASAEPWVPADIADLDVDEAFRVCTAGSIAATDEDAHASFTLYRAATFDQPVHGMYSFVPARLADSEDPRFPRPAVTSPLINPASSRAVWGSKRHLPIGRAREEWESVRRQVLDANLLLGVGLETPPFRPGVQGTVQPRHREKDERC